MKDSTFGGSFYNALAPGYSCGFIDLGNLLSLLLSIIGLTPRATNPQFENSNDNGGCWGNFGGLFLGLIPVASGIYVATRLAAHDDGALLEVGSDTATAAPVAWGAVATVVIVAFIICAIFGRQKWFAARLSGQLGQEASADDDPDESVNEVR